MPYSNIDELPKAVRALPSNLQKQWMEIFNSVFAETGVESDAIAQAWGVINERKRTKSMYVEFSSKAIDGKILLAGIGTTERIDLDNEVVEKESLINCLDKYMQDPVVFDMHIQGAKVGKVLMMNYFEGDELKEFCDKNSLPVPDTKAGLGVVAEIEDVRAKTDILRGLKRGFSIGFETIKRGMNLMITKLKEISIVDVPCNQDCYFSVLKMYKDSGIIEEDVPADVPQKINKEERKINKEINKMNITDTKILAKMMALKIDPNDATEHITNYVKMLVEKDEAEERAKIDADFKIKLEAAKAELEKTQNEKIKGYEEKIKIAEEAAKAMHADELERVKDIPVTQGGVPETFFKSADHVEILEKGKATGEYDLTKFKFGILPGQKMRDYQLLKCKALAQEVMKAHQTDVSVDLSKVHAKFRVKAALDTTTTSTGAYVLDTTFNDFIVDEPFKDNPILMFLAKRPVSTQTFDIRRRTAYGSARSTGESTTFSSSRSTYEKQNLSIKIVRVDGAITKFLMSVDSIDMLAEEIYAAKQAHDQLLETMILHGPGQVVTTALTTETGAVSFKGFAEWAEQFVNLSETVLTQSHLYINMEANYKAAAKQKADLYVFDSATIGKIKDVTDGKIALNSNTIDASIEVETMGGVPIVESFSLNDDSVAAPSFAITKGVGTVNDQVFVQVSAVTIDGETVKATEANDTMSAAESCIITVTNRDSDLYYIVYIGSATGTTYKYKRFEKSSGATTVFTIAAPPTYPTSTNSLEGRVDSDDRTFFILSNNPTRGARLAVNKMGELEMLPNTATEKQFTLTSNVVLEVTYPKSVMHGVIARA